MRMRPFHTWQFPFVVRESHLLFKEKQQSDAEELLKVAERTKGTMESDDINALRDRTEQLVQNLDAAKNEKLGFWRQIGRLFVSKEKVQQKRMDVKINEEVENRIKNTESEAKESLSRGLSTAEMSVIAAKVKQQVITDIAEYLEIDRQRLRSFEQSLTDWIDVLSSKKDISLEDLKASHDIQDLKSRLDIAPVIEKIAVETREKGKGKTPKRFEWGRSAERMLRNQLLEMGVGASELNNLLTQHMEGKSELLDVVKEKLHNRPQFCDMLVSALNRLRSESVRGYQLLAKLTDENPNRGSVQDRLRRLQYDGYPGYSVTVEAGGESIRTVFRVLHTDKNTGKTYAILQDVTDGDRFVIIDLTKSEVAFRVSDEVQRYTLDGKLHSISLSA